MNIANILTLSRMILALFIVVLLLNNSLWACTMAFILFVVAALTDFCDGYCAKKMGLVSDFGKIMDPIADKVLMIAVFSVLAYLGPVPAWMVLIIAAREILVTISRLKARQKGQVLAAESAGKIKTAFQMAAVIVILVFMIAEQSAYTAGWFYRVQQVWLLIINILMYIVVGLTLFSGIEYYKNNRAKL
jgi:CDP-diacylglycerol---glycerol-3-phosphate 3-phosphatidyltransferase